MTVKKNGRLQFRTVSNVITPTPIDTSNLVFESDPNNVTENDQAKEMSFHPLKEITNIYETKRMIIMVIPHMQKIFLTKKKDNTNAPYIRFTSATDVSLIEKQPPNITPNF